MSLHSRNASRSRRGEVMYAAAAVRRHQQHCAGERSRVRHGSVASWDRTSDVRTLPADGRTWSSVARDCYARDDPRSRSRTSSPVASSSTTSTSSTPSTLEWAPAKSGCGRVDDASPAAARRAASQMSIRENFTKQVGKVEAWTVHVTWDERDGLTYLAKERVLVVRPFHEADAQSNCQFQAIALKNKKSPLERHLFEPLVSAMPKNSVMTGRFVTKRRKVAGLLVDAKSLAGGELERCRKRCARAGLVPAPDDALAADSLAYGYLVARFVERFYSRLLGKNELDEDSAHMKPCLKLVFHGVRTAPAFLLLSRDESFDNVLTAYLMSEPVLGHCWTVNQYAAFEEADRLSVGHGFRMERETIKNVDLFYVARRDGSSSKQSKVTKRQYGRLPDNDRHFVDGKCKMIAIKLAE